VPLMELVTEPVIHSAKDAGDFAKEFQLLLRYLGASDANMEKGEMRVEANISIAPADAGSVNDDGTVNFEKLGTKVEVKNLNSFKVVERAIDFEIKRMSELLDEGRGDEIVQETRGWDELKQKTFSQRKKESSDDYRYFPEPDLPKLKISEISEFAEDLLRAELPELPWQKRERFSKFGLSDDQVEIFVTNERFAGIFDEITTALSDEKLIKLAANYITSDLMFLEEGNDSGITAAQIIELVTMIGENKISSRGAKDTLAILVEKGDTTASSKQIAEENNLLQQSDEGALEEIVKKIIADNPDAVAEYKGGKEASLQFLIGQGMRETKGSANPQVLSEIFKKNL
jgi:aspartyl-tRNA(Asn)/glutamyl-tRNA(Gln) amidotransferase subunit B